MRAVIVGAGIGGLAAAVALRQVGVAALVLEGAVEIREVGAGLSLWSNAVNGLRELGIEEKVLAAASLVEQLVLQTPTGKRLGVNDLSLIIRSAGAPCICIHRGVLQQILLSETELGTIQTGARCVGLIGSSALLENGERIFGDVLLGADGISSVIRSQLHEARAPRYAGYTCLRGVYRGDGVLPGRSSLLVVGRGSQFGLWPCGAGQYYWFLTRNAPCGLKYTKDEITELYRDWASPVREVIDATPEEAVIQNDIIDRPPLRWWGRGRVTLLGDAAHATTPNLGQGACQALEDAVVLADCIRSLGLCEQALRSYEKKRIGRTSKVIRESWRGGRALQMESPALEALRNRLIGSSLGRRITMRLFDDLLTYRLPRLKSREQGAPTGP